MKYPGLGPVGGAGEGGWAVAGSDLVRASDLLRDPGDATGRVRLAEVLRRRFAIDGAFAVLRESGPEPTTDELLCLGTVHWTVGDAAAAVAPFTAAARKAAAAGDDDAELAAAIGLARAERIRYRRENRRVLDAAVRAGERSTDEHLLADLDRERAAWALLGGRPDVALDLATRAASVHRAAGDTYLAGLADVLIARAHDARHDERGIAIIREQIEVGARIGSWDLEQIALIFLGQFLQRAVAPDSPQWAEAEEVLARVRATAIDDFTMAEVLLPLAHLHAIGAEFDLAAAELDEYGRRYAALGGNEIGAANLLKARARMELMRHGGTSLRDLRRSPQAAAPLAAPLAAALRDLRRSARAYRRAGSRAGSVAVRRQIAAIGALTGPRTELWWRSAHDPLEAAQRHLVRARRTGRTARAAREYEAAEAAAVEAGATVVAGLAAAGRAEIAHDRGDTGAALAAVRDAVRHVEAVRAAVAGGGARTTIAGIIRDHYEQALLLAASLGDGPLALELVERLRTQRLAGLLRRSGDALPADVSALLTELDDINAALVAGEPGLPPVGTARVVRDLAAGGAARLSARRARLHEQLAARTTAAFAATFGAEPLRPNELSALDDDVLAVVPVRDGERDVVVSVWRCGATGESAVTLRPVDADLAELRDVLSAVGEAAIERRKLLRWRDLLPVTALLPPAFLVRVAAASEPVRIVVVPTGWTWSVPIAAVPLGPDGPLLVERADAVFSPSLRFSVALRDRAVPATAPAAAVSWVDPGSGIDAAEIEHLDTHPGGHVRLGSVAEVRTEFVRGGSRWRTAVLAAHGNREPGLAHAVVDGTGRSALSAADFLDGNAAPPRLISLAACHGGATIGDDPHEPLGLSLAALAAGAEHVLAAHLEIEARGRGPLVRTLVRFYDLVATGTAPQVALAEALRDPGPRDPDLRDRPLYQWAALMVVG